MTKYTICTIIVMILIIGTSMAVRDYSSGITFFGKTADKIVELLSDSCACKEKTTIEKPTATAETSTEEPKIFTTEETTTEKPKTFTTDETTTEKPKIFTTEETTTEKPKTFTTEETTTEKTKTFTTEETITCSVKRPSDCGDLDKSTCKSGIYKIYPNKTPGFNVFCEMEKHGGGWTVFQHRKDGKVDFYLDWESYKNGFGKLDGECWLGNEHLHQITSQGKYKLRIEMQNFENNSRYANYNQFKVGDVNSGYKLTVAGYNGNAGDSFTYHNDQKFTTKDKDNDDHSTGNCAQTYKGAWWYKQCHYSNLNGLYLKGNPKSFVNGIYWHAWNKYKLSPLKTTTMMIRKA